MKKNLQELTEEKLDQLIGLELPILVEEHQELKKYPGKIWKNSCLDVDGYNLLLKTPYAKNFGSQIVCFGNFFPKGHNSENALEEPFPFLDKRYIEALKDSSLKNNRLYQTPEGEYVLRGLGGGITTPSKEQERYFSQMQLQLFPQEK